ncbi:DUF4349 domain-containing protein [Sphingobium sufflavum]|uniref:DUF4349 domain-containing protein n=1 Tax=Sphingobium sufflavum TaxID=1129547 RepID=UPI001F315CA4|nr:DUF4349 domain-containing protein [Sphingobium sufflavum]MCE7797707.1 DUF4349 domain-containing protein [Sphingobium sufflavum]
MRRIWLATTLLLLAACGRKPEAAEEKGFADTQALMPNVAVTRVPGMSLTYQYGFRLPAERLAMVQEEHAAQCEVLTPARCRITGMDYQVQRNRTITASLQMKLAPEIARGFGKTGVETVVKRGGMLSGARIDSEESGAEVEAVDRDNAAVEQERSRIVQQPARPGLSAAERTQLQARLDGLSDQKRQSVAVRETAALKLASTPMTFTYVSGNVDPGLSDGPIIGAIKDGWANIVAGFAIILTVLITLLPWAVLAGLLVWLWRRFGRRLFAARE